MNSKKMNDKRTQVYRRFSFGRRKGDRRQIALMSVPTVSEDIGETAKNIISHMSSYPEFRDHMFAQLQSAGFCVMTFDKKVG